MGNWKDKDFDEGLTAKKDEIYRNLFKVDDIVRSDRKNFINGATSKILDEKLGIDCLIYLQSGGYITSQEKVLRYSKMHFLQLTIEYENNRIGSKYGDWFHLASQIYFFGYATPDETNIAKYWIFDVCKLRLYLDEINFPIKNYVRNNTGVERSSFVAIPVEIIFRKPEIILYYN